MLIVSRTPNSAVQESGRLGYFVRWMNKPLPFPKPRHSALPGAEAQQSQRIPLDTSSRQRAHLKILHAGTRWNGQGLTRLQLAALVILSWTAVGAFENLPELVKGGAWYILAAKMIEAWAWAILTPALLLINKRFHAEKQSIGRVILLFLFLSIPFSLIHTYLTGLLLYPISEVSWNPLRNSEYFIHYNLGGWTHYCAAVSILQAVRFSRSQLQLERVERSLSESRLLALRLHLEPHFLFNSLNAISSEVEKRPKVARKMIADLGALLRSSLDFKETLEVSLAQEVALLERYVSIQKVRFGERLQIRFEVDPDTLSARVPPMLLQPLVENAIRHGIERRRSGGTIVISASRSGDELRLTVSDDGMGLPAHWTMDMSAGHGLRVTVERLMALYPQLEDECLTIERRTGGGTEVKVRVPMYVADTNAPGA